MVDEAVSTTELIEVEESIAKKLRTEDAESQTPDRIIDKLGIDVDIVPLLAEPLSRGMKSPLVQLLSEPSWLSVLEQQFSELYMHDLTRFLAKESKQKIFPPFPHVFAALNTCAFEKVRVVILGQDPYHDDGQAMGLSFSVPQGFKLPSSLLNIFKEIESDLGIPRSTCGDLSPWAKEGVLLLNAVLTVRAHQANSHEGKGWERFTDIIIKMISEKSEKVVFMLWGKFAEKKAARVDSKRHLVLKAPHPSGLSASRGFFGCKHFSKANEYLRSNGKSEINWALL
jgi:uracil-DNA glycosylase